MDLSWFSFSRSETVGSGAFCGLALNPEGLFYRAFDDIATLTSLHVDPDYETLKSELPEGVIPA